MTQPKYKTRDAFEKKFPTLPNVRTGEREFWPTPSADEVYNFFQPEAITPKRGLRMWIKRLFCKHESLKSLGGHYLVGGWRTCQQCKNCEMFKLHF